jgi:hypothetical protein
MLHYRNMDDSSPIFSKEQKDEIYKKFTEALLLALNNNLITVAESELSADFVLQNIDEVASKESLLVFLEDLSCKWPAYKNLYLKEKGEETAVDDQTKIAEIQNSLSVLSNNPSN